MRVLLDEGLAEGDYPIIIRNMKLSEIDLERFYVTTYLETTLTAKAPVDKTVTLDENSTVPPTPSDGDVPISVKRRISADTWSTLCLPFAMTGNQLKAAFGDDVELADFTGYEADYDENDRLTTLAVNFETLDAEDGLEANYPCLIRTSRDIEEFELIATIEPDEENAVVEYDNGKTGRRREVYGTLQGVYAAQTTVPVNCLFLNDNKFWYSTGLTRSKAFRAYFDFVDVLSSVQDAVSEVKFSFWLNDDATRISVPSFGSSETRDYIYTLDGKKLSRENGKRQKGIFIINGKKTLK